MKRSTLGFRAARINTISTGAIALGLLGFTAQAQAADMFAPPPPPPPFPVAAPAPLWSGLYVGAHVGGAWADLETTDLDGYWERSTRYQLPEETPNFNASDYARQRTSQSPSDVFGGGTVGYNIQRGGVVAGIEADFGYMGLNDDRFINAPITDPQVSPTAKARISTGFYGDVTGRLGWAWGPWMIYGKGGIAVLDATTTVSDSFFGTRGTVDDTRVGWTAGGGFEYLWNPAWSVKVEYQYFDFGTNSSTLSWNDAGRTFAFNHDLEVNTVKVGINYHLGCCDQPIPVPVPFK